MYTRKVTWVKYIEFISKFWHQLISVFNCVLKIIIGYKFKEIENHILQYYTENKWQYPADKKIKSERLIVNKTEICLIVGKWRKFKRQVRDAHHTDHTPGAQWLSPSKHFQTAHSNGEHCRRVTNWDQAFKQIETQLEEKCVRESL